MTEAHITQIIPPGAPLPARPPEPGEVPPWRVGPPPPPPPPPAEPRWYSAPDPDPAPLAVRVTFDVVYPTPEPTPRYDWSWLWAWARPWTTLAGAALAVIPLGPHGYSFATGWAEALTECRTEAGLLPAYILALGSVGAAFAIDHVRPRILTRTALAVSLVGTVGMVHPYDIVTAVTGVHL
ncbi:hypothetical protein ACIRBY_23280 [Streptomyces sp. NPDC096136]|uniref:hypothetical protein n=1 Tax=Streptomyces sp. NPDC096136 TaxID=3366076 RepID=UPI0038296655